MGFGKYRFVSFCLITILYTLSEALQPKGEHVIPVIYYESERYESCTGWWWGRSCSNKYRSVQRVSYACESGWTNKEEDTCRHPLCGYLSKSTDPKACNIYTDCKVITKNGTICWSGGNCKSPYNCQDCLPGHYSSKNGYGYCALCQQIPHCNYATCTDYGNSWCKYCEGEITKEYGHYAYTRFTDDGRSCQLACSWRSGSRCYPGNCSETTLSSCLCAPGYSGADCATINADPKIVETEMIFNFIDGNTEEMEIIKGEDEHISWTRLDRFSEVNATVKAEFKQNFPNDPPNYIDVNKSKAGIIRMSLSLYLYRGKYQTCHE